MKIKFKTLLFVALATTILMGFSVAASAKNPQSCADGERYLGSYEYKKSIRKYNACLRSGSLTRESRAISYYNRAVSHFFLYNEMTDNDENFEKAFKHLTKAQDDIDKSIELDPTGSPKAYCLRGWIDLDYTFGMVGYDDLDKGIAMGAPKDLCDYSNY